MARPSKTSLGPALPIGMALLFALGTAAGAELRSLEIHSTAVQRTMRYTVALPRVYPTSNERYPTAYILHGFNGHHRGWDPTMAQRLADHGLILVMPDVGNSWYVNWQDTGNPDSHAYEDYLVNELIEHVDRHFRTVTKPAARALGGFSMGGFGALALGLRHGDRFLSIGSVSGYLDYARGAARTLRQGSRPKLRRRSRSRALQQTKVDFLHQGDPRIGRENFDSPAERTPSGHPFADPAQAAAHDPFTLLRDLPAEDVPHLYLDCGTEDTLWIFANELATLLLERRLPFEFRQAQGLHDNAYRDRGIELMVLAQQRVLRKALAQAEPSPATRQEATTELPKNGDRMPRMKSFETRKPTARLTKEDLQ